MVICLFAPLILEAAISNQNTYLLIFEWQGSFDPISLTNCVQAASGIYAKVPATGLTGGGRVADAVVNYEIDQN